MTRSAAEEGVEADEEGVEADEERLAGPGG
jgi:hypothetical protein